MNSFNPTSFQFLHCIGRVLCVSVVLLASPASGQIALDEPPINYLDRTPSDAVSRLQAALDAGDAQLRYDGQHGYLKSVLAQLNVPVSSQALVFSKTSFQVRHISPRTPRAIYFGDDVYVGWVLGGNIEISAVDPHLGTNFYLLEQQPTVRPQLVRQTYQCLQCHGGIMTRDVPGHVVRSVYPAADGHVIHRAGSFLTDHTSPIKERWGGWYVTGEHGQQRHLGNLVVRQSDDPQRLDTDRGANAADLSKWLNTAPYLNAHSDIVALLVLEHQTAMHNRITRANYLTQIALHGEQKMNQLLDRPANHRADATVQRIQSAAKPVVAYLLFAGEAPLTDAIIGTSGFAEDFAAKGPRDKRGRSLREFDLKTRIFKYPCSYLIYSEAFQSLPRPAKDEVYRGLWNVLTGRDTSEPFKHLSIPDRQAILEILRDTLDDLPEYWRERQNEVN